MWGLLIFKKTWCACGFVEDRWIPAVDLNSSLFEKVCFYVILYNLFYKTVYILVELDMQHSNVYKAECIRPDTPGCLLRPSLFTDMNFRSVLSKSNWRGLAKPLILSRS